MLVYSYVDWLLQQQTPVPQATGRLKQTWLICVKKLYLLEGMEQAADDAI